MAKRRFKPVFCTICKKYLSPVGDDYHSYVKHDEDKRGAYYVCFNCSDGFDDYMLPEVRHDPFARYADEERQNEDD